MCLTLNQFRPFWKIYTALSDERKHMHDHMFDEKNRIYIMDNPIKIKYSDNSKNIELVNKIVEGINKWLNKTDDNMYRPILTNEEYINGKGIDNRDREYKIGKLISKVDEFIKKGYNISDIGLSMDEFNTIKVEFNNRQSKNMITKNLIPVICRHPYDIIGMSTGRRYTSCLEVSDNPILDEDDFEAIENELNRENLTEEEKKGSIGGAFNYKLVEDIKEGTLVAYLIDDNDRNINYPYARIAIKPFKGSNHDIHNHKIITVFKQEENIYHDNSMPKSVYGEFANQVNIWLNQNNKYDTGLIFTKPPKMYDDSRGSDTRIIVDNIDEDWIKEYYNKIIEIRTAREFEAFILSIRDIDTINHICKLHCSSNRVCKLMTDISLSPDIQYHLSSMDFILDGNGHTITFNNCNKSLFDVVEGTIKDIRFKGNIADTSIIKVNSTSGNILNCISNIDVDARYEEYIGGFCNTNNGIIDNCTNIGNIYGDITGGICGENNNIIKNCTNLGNIYGCQISSGIAGISIIDINGMNNITNGQLNKLDNDTEEYPICCQDY